MQHYPPNRVCINTVESRRRWAQLRRVLLVTMLPRWRSGRVRCTPDDFMLMLINPQGDVYFKNVVTRNYLRAPLKIRRDSRISVSGQAHRNVKGKCTPKRERRIWDIK